MKFNLIAISLIIIFFTSSCKKEWSYKGSNNPNNWGNIDEKFKFCKIGYNQSPIDIKDDFILNDLKFNLKKSGGEKKKQKYNLKIEFFDKKIYIVRAKRKFFLYYLDFHHPSEHLVKSNNYSLEMQFIFKSDDEQWITLAYFLEVGDENKNFSELINFLKSKNKESVIDLSKIIIADDKSFFYDGSFTTPPCLEGVKWYIMEKPIIISKNQMNEIIKNSIFVKSNARPVQKFNRLEY
jgi:carbonic anhydrase